jgi:hypothetical protein
VVLVTVGRSGLTVSKSEYDAGHEALAVIRQNSTQSAVFCRPHASIATIQRKRQSGL